MTDTGGPIHLVLPDPIERAACCSALAAETGEIIQCFASADDYLDAETTRGNAILLFHWRQPGRVSGAALLHHVAAQPDIISFVAAERLSLAESGEILRGGARDLLPAPLDPHRVSCTLDHALAEWRARQHANSRRDEAEARLAALTPRERDILDALAAGLCNKAIARKLDLSPRTVEVHRANIMRRASASSIAELLRLQFIAEYAGATPSNRVRNGAGSANEAALVL
jgi:two-component system response regulator FixJ